MWACKRVDRISLSKTSRLTGILLRWNAMVTLLTLKKRLQTSLACRSSNRRPFQSVVVQLVILGDLNQQFFAAAIIPLCCDGRNSAGTWWCHRLTKTPPHIPLPGPRSPTPAAPRPPMAFKLFPRLGKGRAIDSTDHLYARCGHRSPAERGRPVRRMAAERPWPI